MRRRLCLVLIALLGVVLVTLATRWGAGLSPDSASYISIARSLLSGEGFRRLYGDFAGKWPPLYPWLLAFIGRTGADPLSIARWLNAAVFAANITLVGLILKRQGQRAWMPVLGAFLVMSSVDFVRPHSMAWTEPLFFLFGLSALLLLGLYARDRRAGVLVASAVASALAILTRYAGLSLVATGAFVICFLTVQGVRRKLAHSLLFAVIACVPIAGWMVRNAVVSGNTVGRTISYHPIMRGHFESAVATMSSWLLPKWVPPALSAAVLAAAVLGVVVGAVVVLKHSRLSRETHPEPALPKLPAVMATFLVCYLGMLLVSIVFANPRLEPPLDSRILLPIFPACLSIAFWVVGRLRRGTKAMRMIGTAATIAAVVLGVWYANRVAWWVRWAHCDGPRGYTNVQWRESELLSHVKKLDPDVLIFTNRVDAIYCCADRAAIEFPRRFEIKRPNGEFGTKLVQMGKRLENEGGVVVLFKGTGKSHLPRRAELEEALPLRVSVETDRGVIYTVGD